MYKSLKKKEHWALGLGTEGAKTGVPMHLPDWLSGVRLRYQRLAIWVVPWDTTHAKAGVEAEPDDGRQLGGAFGATWFICYHP